MRHVRCRKDPRGLLESPSLDVGTRDLQRPQAPVLNGTPRVGGDTSDEAIVVIEAAKTEPEQVRRMPLDAGRQDPGRGTRGALAAAAVDETDLGSARSKLVGDGSADDAGADDRDLHVPILVGSWRRWLASVVGAGSRWPRGLRGPCPKDRVSL